MDQDATIDQGEDAQEAAAPTFAEWLERVEKLFQMNGRPIPDPFPQDELREPFDLGLTAVEAFEDLVAKME